MLRRGREWVAAHPKHGLAIGGALVVAAIGLTTALFVVSLGGQREEQVTADMALAALDGRSFVEALDLVETLQKKSNHSPEDLAKMAYVEGAILAYETDETWEKDRARSYLLAARHLEEARDRGLPEERRAEAQWLLARSLYLCGRYADSRRALHEALPLNPGRTAEIHRMLAGAHLHAANPQLAEALEHNTLFLAQRRLSKADRDAGQLERAQILFRLGRMEECRREIDGIANDSTDYGEVILLRGRLVLQHARVLKRDPQRIAAGDADVLAKPKYQEAIELFRQAQTHDTLSSNTTRKAMYLIGECYAETGDYKAAYEQLERTRKLYFETPEGLASSLLAADMLRKLKEPEEAVGAYLRTFTAAGNPRTYSNAWISLDEFRLRMTAAYQGYLDREQYPFALELLRGFQPMFSKFRTVELTAQTQRAWADWLERQAREQTEIEARETRKTAAAHYRRAGHTYARLARLRTATREFPEDLWHSADNLLLGQDYTNAVRVLEEYLKNEQRRRRPLALVGLGKAMLAIGQVESSVKAFEECINYYAEDAAIYDARLQCALAYQELGQSEAAEKLLLTNLTGDTLSPSSREWRESLFAVGRLMHAMERYDDAIRYLEEAVARYPEDAGAMEGMYLIAESYRQAAKAPQARLEEATIESVRLEQRREMRRLLDNALKNYVQVQKELNFRTETSPLTELDTAILRNCYFFIGSVLYDLGRYDEAIKAYSDASTRYQSEPIVLEAFLEIANCHRRLHRPVEARGALAQAKVVWKRLPEKADFLQTTNYTRDEWQKLLDQVSAW